MEKQQKKTCYLPSRKGVKLSDETKQKMSAAKKGEPSNHKGKIHSEETKHKMSETKIAKYKRLKEQGMTNDKEKEITQWLIKEAIEKQNRKQTIWLMIFILVGGINIGLQIADLIKHLH